MKKSTYQSPTLHVTMCYMEESFAAGSVTMEFDTELNDQIEMVEYEKEDLGSKDLWF